MYIQALDTPTYVEWYHNGARVVDRRLITPLERIAEGTAMSTLRIDNARAADAGTYTCWPALMSNDTVRLHVVESEFQSVLPDA